MGTCWIEALSAFATLAAAGVALYFGNRGLQLDLRRQEEERLRQLLAARLYACSIRSQLKHVQAEVGNSISALQYERPELMTDQWHVRALLEVRRRLREERFRPSAEGLLALSAAPGDVAGQLAKAFDHIELIRMRADSVPDAVYNPGEPIPLYRDEIVGFWLDHLVKAHSFLHFARVACEELADNVMPEDL
jgi:hypothetical protein